MKTMAVGKVGSTILKYHNEDKPADDEWDVFVEALRTAGPGTTAILTLTDGGGPTPTQRKRAAQAILTRDEPIPAAVLSDSMVVRGMITAVKWMGVSIAAFRPSELDEALGYLGLPLASKRPIEEAFARLKASVQSG